MKPNVLWPAPNEQVSFVGGVPSRWSTAEPDLNVVHNGFIDRAPFLSDGTAWVVVRVPGYETVLVPVENLRP